ncbi:TIR domain-containing protein [Larkinella humicola]|uniref:CD-NTase-associated protein 12/Pycsar effector protein TIR domain-containing protein n=1 Tax=Larkinella humicola TaxID=2607654 RepID=A0A5N1JCE1_9BACT|nr:TIR domain-containing protein [Larkinella humicola]KAA9346799.1 hypothetical protein F0P93_27760 [Larkinella humicola]
MSLLSVDFTKKTYVAFYSWQSDLDAKNNKNLISSCVEKAKKEINKKNISNLEFEIGIDRDTKNKSGSPSIADTIFEKISKADIFICDITIINNSSADGRIEKRLTPNPNVLIELGFAVHVLGWERVILINNSKFGQPEVLPFDIRGRRISNYNSDDPSSRSILTSILKTALISIIEDYDNILTRHSQIGIISHDKNIYMLIKNICSEIILKEGITTAANSLYTSAYYYNIWTNLEKFYEETQNHFLDKELDLPYRNFIVVLNDFHYKCAAKFFREEGTKSPTIWELEQSGVKITEYMRIEYEQGIIYSAIKKPFSGETWPEADDRIQEMQEELLPLGEKVKLSYRQLILRIKAKLMT